MRTVRKNIFLAFILLFAPFVVFAQGGGGPSLNITSLTSALLLVAVVLGVLFNLWKTTRKYGGIIGKGLRLMGTGIVFLSIEALDRAVEFPSKPKKQTIHEGPPTQIKHANDCRIHIEPKFTAALTSELL